MPDDGLSGGGDAKAGGAAENERAVLSDPGRAGRRICRDDTDRRS
jgi:hypothetical protein